MNIASQEGEVSQADRQALLNQTSVTIWFTGISGSGKSSIGLPTLSWTTSGYSMSLGENHEQPTLFARI
jgi:adenylylsulfate kinase-like enzyme